MPGNPLTNPNWAPELADQITTLVGNVRDKTTVNAIKAIRAAVFGFVCAVMGAMIIVLALIALTRGVQSLIDVWSSWDKAVYLSYFIVGGILTLAGGYLLGKRAG